MIKIIDFFFPLNLDFFLIEPCYVYLVLPTVSLLAFSPLSFPPPQVHSEEGHVRINLEGGSLPSRKRVQQCKGLEAGRVQRGGTECWWAGGRAIGQEATRVGRSRWAPAPRGSLAGILEKGECGPSSFQAGAGSPWLGLTEGSEGSQWAAAPVNFAHPRLS